MDPPVGPSAEIAAYTVRQRQVERIYRNLQNVSCHGGAGCTLQMSNGLSFSGKRPPTCAYVCTCVCVRARARARAGFKGC